MYDSSQSPPYAVSEDERRKAEAVFLNFRTSKLPYEACKYVLGMIIKVCV